MPDVRTRFAPSPTGYMHIGGMRTALFNWLFARRYGGSFILRIDDTDLQRNIEEALDPILHAFRWLELDWDEGPGVGGDCGPYFQSQRFDKYREAVERLLSEGKAYRDFEPPEQVKADREAAEKEGRTYLGSRRSLELSDEQVQQYVEQGKSHVIRFLVPRSETVLIDDAIRGRVEWDGGRIPDPVLVRSDGSPLYNFATVVDDAQMAITHVIRAEEHLSNTPVQALLHQALGHEAPVFAHVPYVAAPGGKDKLSKRKLDKYRKNPQFKKMFERADFVFPQIGLGDSTQYDPVMVAYYEKIGYLPQAVFNALARLGWSLDDKTETMDRDTVVNNFSLDRVVKSPAGFDPDKLDSFQLHWMGQLSREAKLDGCLPYLEESGLREKLAARLHESGEAEHDYIGRVIDALGERLVVFSDILSFAEFFVLDEELSWDEKAFEKRLRKPEDAAGLLKKFRDTLENIEPFDAETTEQAMRDFCEAEGIKLGGIIHTVRVAVTGKPTGPGMFDCLALLGKASCLRRIDRALERV